jgi:signal transduction histidine kinase/HPt (histidine-containing phosphotransfer) domain-containing protein/ActR/RegA family two-component response regulator
LTPLGALAIASVGRSRVRRKAFDVVRALGGERDLAARVAGEVSDAVRWLERHAHEPRLDLALDAADGRIAVVFDFAWAALADGAGGPPAAILGRERAPRRITVALRGATAAPEAVARARAVLASRSREELFAGLEASNEALARASAEAQQASAAKARFLAHMSHEIRTPMNAILGMNRLALGTELTPLQRGYLEKVEASSRHLLAIVDDVLDVSKIEAGKVVLESEDLVLERVLDDVTTLAGGACADKGLWLRVELAADVPGTVQGDALRLRQVLVNLVTNAVKFTERGGVTVSVAATPAPDGRIGLRFAVRDTGIGLDEAQRRRLFQAFAQADPTIARRYGGTGLGLAICKSLVELMEGEIGVESRPGAGSTFWFTARFGPTEAQATDPSAARAAPRVPPPAAPPALDAGARILLVEDHRLNQEVAIGLLEELGLRATVVADGQLALDALRSRPFDLVLMDVQMPVMDGLTATRRLRADPALRALPVIAMTAGALAADREDCLAAGMNDVVTKPIDPDDLRRALARWLVRRDGAGPAAGEPPHPSAPADPDAPAPATATAPAPTELPRGVPGLDVDRGLRYARGRPDLYLGLLRGFLDDQRELAPRLNEALARDDLATVERLAHTHRGLASGLGAAASARAAEALETAVREGAARAMIDEAARVLATAHAALDAALRHHASTPLATGETFTLDGAQRP